MNATHGVGKSIVLYTGCALLVAVLVTLASTTMDDDRGAQAAPRTNPAARYAPAPAKPAANGSLSALDTPIVYVAQAPADERKAAPAEPPVETTPDAVPALPAGPAPGIAAEERGAKRNVDVGPIVQKSPQIDMEKGPLGASLRRKGNLTLKAATLKEALLTVSDVWKVNIVLGSDVEGSVDAAFVDTPLSEILETILTTNGYGYKVTRNTIKIAKSNEIGWDHPLFQTVMIPLRAATPEDAIALIKVKQSENGQQMVMAGSKTLLISDFPERIEAIFDIVQKFDAAIAARSTDPAAATSGDLDTEPRKTQQFALQHAKLSLLAQTLQDALKPILSSGAHVQLFENENKFTVHDHPRNLAQVEDVLSRFDTVNSVPRARQFSPDYIKAVSLALLLEKQLSKDGKLEVVEAENRLTVVDYPNVLERFSQLVKDMDKPSAPLKTVKIQLQYVKAESLLSGIQSLLSRDGKVLVDDTSEELTITDYANIVPNVEKLVAEADVEDKQTQVVALRGQNASVELMMESMKAAIDKEGGVVTLQKDENQLLVIGSPSTIELAKKTFRQLDVRRPQVRITCLIYDMSVEDVLKLGVNWGSNTKARNSTSIFRIDSVTNTPFLNPALTATTIGPDMGATQPLSSALAPSSPAGALTLMNLSQNMDFAAIVNALCTLRSSELLADPTIVVGDQRQGVIKAVQEIPIQQITQGTTTGAPVASTAFKEAGITLTLTPRIADDDTIDILVNPVFSRLVGFTTGATANPILDSRSANTTVRVTNGQTLVLGGMRQRSTTKNANKIPGLGDIKHLGHLFKYRDQTTTESELVVFLRPEIVTPDYSGSDRHISIRHSGESVLENIPFDISDCRNGVESGPGSEVPTGSPTPAEDLPSPGIPMKASTGYGKTSSIPRKAGAVTRTAANGNKPNATAQPRETQERSQPAVAAKKTNSSSNVSVAQLPTTIAAPAANSTHVKFKPVVISTENEASRSNDSIPQGETSSRRTATQTPAAIKSAAAGSTVDSPRVAKSAVESGASSTIPTMPASKRRTALRESIQTSAPALESAALNQYIKVR